MEICVGVGVYVCGEEMLFFNSFEGKCGIVWVKLLFFVFEGFFGWLMVVNNVIFLVMVFVIFEKGVDFYWDFGFGWLCGMIFV